MDFPDDLKYSDSHAWVRTEGKEAVIGISAYAAEELGEIDYVDLPEEGEELIKDVAFGVVESVKTNVDLYAPLSGKVVETNTGLRDSPEVVNEDPYGDGWMVRVLISDPAQLEDLMEKKEYAGFVQEEQEP